MAGSVLRVRKKGMSVTKTISLGIFPAAHQHVDGFNFTVSASDIFEDQVSEVLTYLRANEKALKELIAQLKPEAPVLDFGVWQTDSVSQSVTFPVSLIEYAGRLGFELSVTMYAASDL